MASRYGRNKRAEHRRVVAELTRRLERESTAHLFLPGDGVLDLESFARISGWSVLEDGSLFGRVDRSAVVVIDAPAYALMDQIYEGNTRVQFKGRQYIIGSASIDSGLSEKITLELVGVM